MEITRFLELPTHWLLSPYACSDPPIPWHSTPSATLTQKLEGAKSCWLLLHFPDLCWQVRRPCWAAGLAQLLAAQVKITVS